MYVLHVGLDVRTQVLEVEFAAQLLQVMLDQSVLVVLLSTSVTGRSNGGEAGVTVESRC